jgi:tight adherence protein C
VIPAEAGGLALCTFGLAVVGTVLVRDRGLIGRFETAEPEVAPVKRRGPISRLFEGLGARFAPSVLSLMGEKRLARLRRRLDAAGRPMTVEQYASRKGAFSACCLLLAIVLAIRGQWYISPFLLGAGWLWVDMYIDRTGRYRQARIDRDLPDFLDILAVCVNAGIAFRPALARVADAVGGPLGDEVTLTLRQLSLGATRREAFEGLRSRNTSEPLSNFTSSLLQAEELGVPLAEALVDLARDMRRGAYQDARRRAARAAPRISLVVTTLIVPAVLLLVLGALFIGASHNFGSITGG